MKRVGQLLLWMLLWLLASVASAQDTGDPDAAGDSGQGEEEVPITDQPGGIEAAGEDTQGDEDGDGESEDEAPGRFIPSEQISQDLGVSFPADI